MDFDTAVMWLVLRGGKAPVLDFISFAEWYGNLPVSDPATAAGPTGPDATTAPGATEPAR